MFSQNTTDLLMEVSSFSNRKINNLNDVGLLIEICNGSNNLEPVAFTAKYLTGLNSVMNESVPISEEAKENIQTEFSKCVTKLRSLIEAVLENENPEVVKMFTHKYLQLNQESFADFMSLAGDLSLYKEYLNSLK